MPSLHQRSNPELKITQGISFLCFKTLKYSKIFVEKMFNLVKGIPIRPYQQDFDEKYFLSSDTK